MHKIGALFSLLAVPVLAAAQPGMPTFPSRTLRQQVGAIRPVTYQVNLRVSNHNGKAYFINDNFLRINFQGMDTMDQEINFHGTVENDSFQVRFEPDFAYDPEKEPEDGRLYDLSGFGIDLQLRKRNKDFTLQGWVDEDVRDHRDRRHIHLTISPWGYKGWIISGFGGQSLNISYNDFELNIRGTETFLGKRSLASLAATLAVITYTVKRPPEEQ